MRKTFFIKICDLFLFFLLFFNVKLRGIPITPVMVLAGIGMVVFFLQLPDIIKKGRINKALLKLLGVYVLLLLCILIALIINGTSDFSIFKLFTFDLIIIFFAAYFIVFRLCKNNIQLVSVIKYIVIVYFIQMLIVLFLFFNKDLSVNLLKYIDMGDKINDRLDKLSAFRAFGIGFGFDFGTACLTCACLCGLYLYLSEKTKNLRWLLIVMYCSFVGIFVARTMFIGIAYLFMFFICFPCKYDNRKIKTAFLFILLLAVLIIVLASTIDLTKYEKTIEWAFELFTSDNYSKGEGSLYKITHDMIFYPGDRTFLLGDGLFYEANGSQYMDTDVGYMRLILYFGLFGTLCTILFINVAGKNFFNNQLENSNKKNKELNALALGLVIFQFIFMYKIMYLFSRLFILFIVYNIYHLFTGKINTKSIGVLNND